MIRFSCPSCGVRISVPEDYGGYRGKCPECGHLVNIPKSSEEKVSLTNAPHTDKQNDPENARPTAIPCPRCGKPVRRSAKVCKKCGLLLDRMTLHKAEKEFESLDFDELLEEYEVLIENRRLANAMSLLFGLLWFISLLAFGFLGPSASIEALIPLVFSLVSLALASIFYAHYKGRSAIMGLMFGFPLLLLGILPGVVGLILMKDKAKERMHQIEGAYMVAGRSEELP